MWRRPAALGNRGGGGGGRRGGGEDLELGRPGELRAVGQGALAAACCSR